MENEGKTKNKFWKGFLVGSLVMVFVGLGIVAVALGIFLIGGVVTEQKMNQNAYRTDGYEETKKINMEYVTGKLGFLEDLVDEYFLFEKDTEQLESNIYKGMMYALEDPYSVYYTEEEFAELTEDISGTYCGIGVQVSQNLSTGTITVTRVFKNSPAAEAGMQKGDRIYKVGEVIAPEEDLDLLVKQYIRGEEGTYVDLTVLRGDENEEVALHVERRMVEQDTVEYQMLADQTGYVLVTQFDSVTTEQFKSAVNELTLAGMERLIIDLRDNPGGVLDAAIDMAAYILPENDRFDGTILSTANKYGDGVRYYCENGKIRFESDTDETTSSYPKEDRHEVDLPIAVLINGESASASELFSGALRDYDAAILVGTTSYGKGIMQSVIPLTDGSGIKLTTAYYYTPSGYCVHEKGLEPDVEVELEVSDEFKNGEISLDKDNQVQRAIEALKEQN